MISIHFESTVLFGRIKIPKSSWNYFSRSTSAKPLNYPACLESVCNQDPALWATCTIPLSNIGQSTSNILQSTGNTGQTNEQTPGPTNWIADDALGLISVVRLGTQALRSQFHDLCHVYRFNGHLINYKSFMIVFFHVKHENCPIELST
jgi:hypothetical protein